MVNGMVTNLDLHPGDFIAAGQQAMALIDTDSVRVESYSRRRGCRSSALATPLPTGDGVALIRRRPDIRQAERAIAGDTAHVGVAAADLYPPVSIGGSLGLTGPLRSFTKGSAFGFSLGPLLSWSFPNRPIVRVQIAATDAQVQADLAQFDGTVIEALRQTEAALETYRRDVQRADALAAASDSAALSAGQAGRLFRFGRGDFLSLLDAQRSYAGADVTSAAARATGAGPDCGLPGPRRRLGVCNHAVTPLF